jgi:hypothetical protein
MNIYPVPELVHVKVMWFHVLVLRGVVAMYVTGVVPFVQ